MGVKILGAVVNFIFRLKDGANSKHQMNLDWKQAETFLTLYSELLGLVPSGYTPASGCPDRKAGGKPSVRTETCGKKAGNNNCIWKHGI